MFLYVFIPKSTASYRLAVFNFSEQWFAKFFLINNYLIFLPFHRIIIVILLKKTIFSEYFSGSNFDRTTHLKTPFFMVLNRMTPDQKALKINLDPAVYGSFAEIGAGQAVADLFFRAGAASGTIAKTMSAYDMKFSDAIYGAETSGRYVCESRLIKMIAHEYKLCEERLPHRREKTCFFAFANTVEVLNFNKTNKGHGWFGVRFQLKPQGEPNDLVVHVKFLDNHRHLQQEA
jgi:hypothetical protein